MANRTGNFLDLLGIAIPGLAAEPAARKQKAAGGRQKASRGPDPQRAANFLEVIRLWEENLIALPGGENESQK